MIDIEAVIDIYGMSLYRIIKKIPYVFSSIY